MKILQNLYFSTLFWAVFIAIGLLFLVAYVFPVLFGTVKLVFVLWVVLTLTDALLLFKNPKGIFARRDTPERLSNGDENPLQLHLQNNYNFKTKLEIIDEIPFQFQRRDVLFEATLTPHQTQLLRYQLRPTKRGE
ncbi:MAG: DUF58 domain-containing protein, partial [Runella slithyformis]